MTSKRCYARFKLIKNDIGVSKYRVIFTIGNRTTKTNTLNLENNKSKDVSTKLNNNESIKDCNAFVDMFLSDGTKINSKPFLLKVTDISLDKEYSRIGFSRISSTNYLYTLFKFDVTTARTEINPNTKKTQTIYSLNNAPDIPYGLRWVAYLRDQIKQASKKNNVDKMSIASIIFQEKYHGSWAMAKNHLIFYIKHLKPTTSYGYGEMQLELAAKLLGIENEQDYLRKTFDIITTNAEVAVDLVALNIRNEERRRDSKLSVTEATVFHNTGLNGLNSYINGEVSRNTIINSIYGRSWNWQNAISEALNGILIGQPDNCELKSCNAYIEQDVDKWQYSPNQPTQF